MDTHSRLLAFAHMGECRIADDVIFCRRCFRPAGLVKIIAARCNRGRALLCDAVRYLWLDNHSDEHRRNYLDAQSLQFHGWFRRPGGWHGPDRFRDLWYGCMVVWK